MASAPRKINGLGKEPKKNRLGAGVDLDFSFFNVSHIVSDAVPGLKIVVDVICSHEVGVMVDKVTRYLRHVEDLLYDFPGYVRSFIHRLRRAVRSPVDTHE